MEKIFRKYVAKGVLILAVLAVAGIPALAKDSQTVTLRYGAVLNGKTLSAGKYTVQWETHSPQATVQFLRRQTVIATAEGAVEQRDKIYDQDTVVYNSAPDGSKSVVEIRFGGSNKVLVFNH